jgi:DNA-binding LacI/PurR family transcriptional regulator
MQDSTQHPEQEVSEKSSEEPVTIQRVADDLGIHYSTVSLALSGKGRVAAATRERVLSYAAQLGYEPDARAQSLRRQADGNVICLCSGALEPGRSTQKIVGVQRALTAAGWEAPFHSPSGKPTRREYANEPQAALFRQLRRQRPRAIVCSAHALKDGAFKELELYQRSGGLVVTFDVPVPLECDQVVFDRDDNAYQAVRYLWERGHRKIGIAMSSPPQNSANANTIPQNLRMEGFLRASREFGFPLREDWLFYLPLFELGGVELARRFLALPERPTGLCVVNDYVALGFMAETIRAGIRIPDDLSLVGLDGQLVAAFCPVPLTCVTQPEDAIVTAVVQVLLERLKGDAGPVRTIKIRSHLDERESVRRMA